MIIVVNPELSSEINRAALKGVILKSRSTEIKNVNRGVVVPSTF
jgi:hypothetical protein